MCVSPSDPEAPPRGLNVTATSNGLRVAWEAPVVLAGPTFYLVQVTSSSVKMLITYRANNNKYHSTSTWIQILDVSLISIVIPGERS